jgi:hypothetical protein
MATFKTKVLMAEGMDATGLVVPDEIVAVLGRGKKPKVTVAINGYAYRSTVCVMDGRFMLPLAKEHRASAGVKAGQTVAVTIALDEAPREVAVPKDLAAELKAAGVAQAFAAMSYTQRKEHVRSIEEAKAAETRARRIAKTVEAAKAKRG